MKLLFMAPKLSSYSGAPKILAWVANQMSGCGNDVAVVTMYKSEAQQELDHRVRLVRINGMQSKHWLYRNTIGMVKVLRGYRAFVKEYKPDVIVSFLDSVSYFYIILDKLFFHDKILVSERVDPSSRKGWKARVHFWIMSMGDYAVFQTENARDFFGDRYIEKSVVIPNPVVKNESLSKAVAIRRSEGFARNKSIISVGRLSIKQKRQDVLLDAFEIFHKEYPQYSLLIYGSGKDEEKIHHIITQKNLQDAVILMGQHPDIPEKIVNGAMFILTSDYEGIPNALIEAMSVGIPCIATDCSPGGARMVIENEQNGYIVPCGNPKAVAEKMIEIVNTDMKAEEMSLRAMKISEKFSERNIAQLWDQAITDCFNEVLR